MSKLNPIKLANQFSNFINKFAYQDFYKSPRNNLFGSLLGGLTNYTNQVGAILQKFVLAEKQAGKTSIEEVNITGYFVMPVVENDVASAMAGFDIAVEWDYVNINPSDQIEWFVELFTNKVKPAILAKYKGKITTSEVAKLLAATNVPGGVDNTPEQSCVATPWKFAQTYFEVK